MDISTLTNFVGQYFDIIMTVLVLILSFVAAKTINYTLKHHVVKLTSKTKTDLDDMIVNALRKPILLGLILFGIYYALTNISYFFSHAELVNQTFIFVQVFFTAFVVAGLINTFLNWYAKEIAVKTESNLDNNFLPAIKKVIYLIVFLV